MYRYSLILCALFNEMDDHQWNHHSLCVGNCDFRNHIDRAAAQLSPINGIEHQPNNESNGSNLASFPEARFDRADLVQELAENDTLVQNLDNGQGAQHNHLNPDAHGLRTAVQERYWRPAMYRYSLILCALFNEMDDHQWNHHSLCVGNCDFRNHIDRAAAQLSPINGIEHQPNNESNGSNLASFPEARFDRADLVQELAENDTLVQNLDNGQAAQHNQLNPDAHGLRTAVQERYWSPAMYRCSRILCALFNEMDDHQWNHHYSRVGNCDFRNHIERAAAQLNTINGIEHQPNNESNGSNLASFPEARFDRADLVQELAENDPLVQNLDNGQGAQHNHLNPDAHGLRTAVQERYWRPAMYRYSLILCALFNEMDDHQWNHHSLCVGNCDFRNHIDRAAAQLSPINGIEHQPNNESNGSNLASFPEARFDRADLVQELAENDTLVQNLDNGQAAQHNQLNPDAHGLRTAVQERYWSPAMYRCSRILCALFNELDDHQWNHHYSCVGNCDFRNHIERAAAQLNTINGIEHQPNNESNGSNLASFPEARFDRADLVQELAENDPLVQNLDNGQGAQHNHLNPDAHGLRTAVQERYWRPAMYRYSLILCALFNEMDDHQWNHHSLCVGNCDFRNHIDRAAAQLSPINGIEHQPNNESNGSNLASFPEARFDRADLVQELAENDTLVQNLDNGQAAQHNQLNPDAHGLRTAVQEHYWSPAMYRCSRILCALFNEMDDHQWNHHYSCVGNCDFRNHIERAAAQLNTINGIEHQPNNESNGSNLASFPEARFDRADLVQELAENDPLVQNLDNGQGAQHNHLNPDAHGLRTAVQERYWSPAMYRCSRVLCAMFNAMDDHQWNHHSSCVGNCDFRNHIERAAAQLSPINGIEHQPNNENNGSNLASFAEARFDRADLVQELAENDPLVQDRVNGQATQHNQLDPDAHGLRTAVQETNDLMTAISLHIDAPGHNAPNLMLWDGQLQMPDHSNPPFPIPGDVDIHDDHDDLLTLGVHLRPGDVHTSHSFNFPIASAEWE